MTRVPTCYIVQGDCLDLLTALPDNLVDLTITDPAWESIEKHRAIGTTTRLKESKSSSNPWFDKFFPDSFYHYLFRQLLRVHKQDSHAYIFCDDETEDVILTGRRPQEKKLTAEPQTWPPAAIGWTPWPSLIWWKTKRSISLKEVERIAAKLQAAADAAAAAAQDDPMYKSEMLATLAQQLSGGGMGWHWRKDSERILLLEKGRRQLNDKGSNGVLFGAKAGRQDYPTQKPLSVLRRLIENASNPGDLVLDFFAGSGNTGIAAIQTRRDALLIDINCSYMQSKTQWPTECNLVWTNPEGLTTLLGHKRMTRRDAVRPYDELERFILEDSRLSKAITHCSRLVAHPGTDGKSRLLVTAHATADALARVTGTKVESALADNHGMRLLLLADLQQAGYIECPGARFEVYDVDFEVIP